MFELSALAASASLIDVLARLLMVPTVSTFAGTSSGIAYDDAVRVSINEAILAS